MDTENLIHQKQQNNPAIIAGMAMTFLLPVILTIIVSGLNISSFDKLFYSRFIYWFTALFLFFYARQVERQPMLLWKEENNEIGFFLISVVVLYLLFIGAAFVSAIPMLFGFRESNEVLNRIAQLFKGHEAIMIFTAFTAGVTEELIFRGYLLTRLFKYFKEPYLPVIISSLMFSALHYKYHSLREFVASFLIGAIFSVYYIKYRNIKALIVTHFLIDFISLTLAQHIKVK